MHTVGEPRRLLHSNGDAQTPSRFGLVHLAVLTTPRPKHQARHFESGPGGGIDDSGMQDETAYSASLQTYVSVLPQPVAR